MVQRFISQNSSDPLAVEKAGIVEAVAVNIVVVIRDPHFPLSPIDDADERSGKGKIAGVICPQKNRERGGVATRNIKDPLYLSLEQ
jgi:hypothetical protein